MENLFLDEDFEEGMVFLMETFYNCVENKLFGFINRKSIKFYIRFCFNGLKYHSIKRKTEDSLCILPKKKCKVDSSGEGSGTSNEFKKMSLSLENLFLDSNTTDVIDANSKQLLKKEKIEPDLNEVRVSRGRKRVANEVKLDVHDEKFQLKKLKKKTLNI